MLFFMNTLLLFRKFYISFRDYTLVVDSERGIFQTLENVINLDQPIVYVEGIHVL